MPYNGAGVYAPPAADFPVVANTLIQATKFNNTINDISTALSSVVTRDGQGKPSADFLPNLDVTWDLGSASKRWMDLWLNQDIHFSQVSFAGALGARDLTATRNWDLPDESGALLTRTAQNAIIGGDFGTNPWQRGTSFAAMATTQVMADRFKYLFSGTMVFTGAKIADGPTVAQCGRLVTHCLELDCTTADAAIAAGDFSQVSYRIEGYDFMNTLAQRRMYLSFWHKHTKTGIYCVAVTNSGNDRGWIAEYTQDVSNTWEQALVEIDASPSAGTWNYTNGTGLRIVWSLAAGSTFHGTADSWISTGAIATANQVNACDSNTNFFRLALCQIVSFDTNNFFERPAAEELALCQRYYAKTFNQGVTPAQNAGTSGICGGITQVAGATTVGWSWSYPTPMRATPTLTTYNPSAANVQARDVSAGLDCTLTGGVFITEHSVLIACIGNAGSAAGNAIGVHATVDAEL